MPDDASQNGEGPKLERDLPAGIRVAEGVDLTLEDPAAEETRRRCIAVRSAGGRCRVNAMDSRLLCPAHAGILNPSAGGHAKAAKNRQTRLDAENRMINAKMGTRASIARIFEREFEKVEKTISLLLESAAGGDLASAKLLIPYLNQGLGMPGQTLQVEGQGERAEVAQLPTSELRLLAREARSHAG